MAGNVMNHRVGLLDEVYDPPIVAPELIGVGTVITDFATVTPMPAGHEAGDLLLVLSSTSGAGDSTPPAGWSVLSGTPQGAGGASGGYLTAWYKFAESSAEASVLVQGSNLGKVSVALAFRGVDPTTPIDISSVSYIGSSSGPSFPDITTTTDGCYLVLVVANGYDDDPPPNTDPFFDWTASALIDFGQLAEGSSGASDGAALGVGGGVLAEAGALGSASVTLSVGDLYNTVASIALRAAPAE